MIDVETGRSDVNRRVLWIMVLRQVPAKNIHRIMSGSQTHQRNREIVDTRAMDQWSNGVDFCDDNSVAVEHSDGEGESGSTVFFKASVPDCNTIPGDDREDGIPLCISDGRTESSDDE